MEKENLKQFKLGVAILVLLVAIGTIGYKLIEPDFGLLDAVYMTIISMSTTGFHEVKPLSNAGRIFTIFVIISGIMSIAYIGGKGVQILIERQFFRRRKMAKKLSEVSNHYIVCGYGRMGRVIVEGLQEHDLPFVVVENDSEVIQLLSESGILYVEGDATNDEALLKAGIKRAKGLVAVLQSDSENVFTVLSARELNPKLFIVARATEERSYGKLLKAGANRVVNPYDLGGSRMLYLLMKPGVMDFIDGIARSKEHLINLEEVTIAKSSPLAGKRISESNLREELNVIIVAIHRENGEFIYNPRSNVVLKANDKLIAIGDKESLAKLDKYCLGG